MPVLEMTDMNMRGAAFCRYDGAAVFVPGCADGDVCEAELSPGAEIIFRGTSFPLSPRRRTGASRTARYTANAADARSGTSTTFTSLR